MSKDIQEDTNENVVIAIYPTREEAERNIDGLKQWDQVNDSIKLGAVGLIYKDGEKVKTHIGRKVGKGMGVGAAIGVIGAVLTGGALLAGALALGAAGGALGAFFKKSMQLTKEEIAEIGAELDAGKVAVVVNCDAHEIESVTGYLASPTSTVRVYKVPEDALAEVTESTEIMEQVTEDQASA
jgi:hypothetical protein